MSSVGAETSEASRERGASELLEEKNKLSDKTDFSIALAGRISSLAATKDSTASRRSRHAKPRLNGKPLSEDG